MTAPAATKILMVSIDPETGDTYALDPITHQSVKNSIRLKSGEEAAWTCSIAGLPFDFELTWEDGGPPVELVHSHTWKNGKQKRHSFRRSHTQLTKVETYKYTVRVFNADGTTRAALDPDMVMDTN